MPLAGSAAVPALGHQLQRPEKRFEAISQLGGALIDSGEALLVLREAPVDAFESIEHFRPHLLEPYHALVRVRGACRENFGPITAGEAVAVRNLQHRRTGDAGRNCAPESQTRRQARLSTKSRHMGTGWRSPMIATPQRHVAPSLPRADQTSSPLTRRLASGMSTCTRLRRS